MRFNDSHAAEFGQDSGEVRAIYMLLGFNCCFRFASPQLGATFSAPASDVAACVRRAIPLACPRFVLAISALLCSQAAAPTSTKPPCASQLWHECWKAE